MSNFAKTALLLFVFALPFTKPSIAVGGSAASLADLFFIVVAIALAVAVVTKKSKLRWHGIFAVLIAYLAAMLLSCFAAEDPGRALIKFASQAYLVSLPVMAYCLIDSVENLRRVCWAWLAATAVVAGIGFVTVLLFGFGVDHQILDYALHGFGTLPPGDYPRLESTFSYPAMLCNYLSVSLAILLACWHLDWIRPAAFYALLVALGVTALFTLTPGLGGIFLLLGAWLFLLFRQQSRPVAIASLAFGGAIALLAAGIATVTPIVHPTAPFLIEIPGFNVTLAPSVRMMTWMAAATVFLQHPLLGAGLGSQAIAVTYVAPSGATHVLTDAHNVFLNVAMHSGVAGLLAMLLLISVVWRLTIPFRLEGNGVLRVALGLAWLTAFAYQGLTGSYEDARHLWLLLGLLLAAIRLTATTNLDQREPL